MCIQVIQDRICQKTLSFHQPLCSPLLATSVCALLPRPVSASSPRIPASPAHLGAGYLRIFFSSSFQTQVFLNRVWIIHVLVADSGKALSSSVIFLLDFITSKTVLVGAVNACKIKRISSERQNDLDHTLPITLS